MQPSVDDINKQSAYARQNTVTGIVGGTINRGPNGTTLVVNQPTSVAHPWWVGVSYGKVRVVIGNVVDGDNAQTEIDKLSMVARGLTNAVPFNFTDCNIANAVYEKENQVWTFPHTPNVKSVVWVDGSGSKPELKYTALSAYSNEEKTKATPIAITIGDGRVVQLVSSDIWSFTSYIDDFIHPFKVIDIGGGKVRVVRGSVFSYPNYNWVDVRGGNNSGTTYPNSIKWADNVPNVGGQWFDESNCEFMASSFGSDFDIYLKFERKGIKHGEAISYDYWAEPIGDFTGWECRLCVGTIGTSQLEGNYNTSVADPPTDPNYKPYVNNSVTLNGSLIIPDLLFPNVCPISLTYQYKVLAVKFFSTGVQYYKVARVTKQTVTVPSQEQGGQPTIQTKYIADQNLRSDFFFFPPLDNGVTIFNTIPLSIGNVSILEPSGGE